MGTGGVDLVSVLFFLEMVRLASPVLQNTEAACTQPMTAYSFRDVHVRVYDSGTEWQRLA